VRPIETEGNNENEERNDQRQTIQTKRPTAPAPYLNLTLILTLILTPTLTLILTPTLTMTLTETRHQQKTK
jgi:hypothetical protein